MRLLLVLPMMRCWRGEIRGEGQVSVLAARWLKSLLPRLLNLSPVSLVTGATTKMRVLVTCLIPNLRRLHRRFIRAHHQIALPNALRNYLDPHPLEHTSWVADGGVEALHEEPSQTVKMNLEGLPESTKMVLKHRLQPHPRCLLDRDGLGRSLYLVRLHL
jgi:hypothetical protein